MRTRIQQGESGANGEQPTCLDVSGSNGRSTSGSDAWKSSLSGQGLLHREGDGSSDTGTSSGGEARSNRLHTEHGGSSGGGSNQRSYRLIDDGGDGSGRADDAGVNETSWFDPVETDCPGGICSVPWSTKNSIDNVNHPSHYKNAAGIECIEAIEAQLTEEEYRGYLKGNIAKYIWRERHKGGVDSLEKANWYLKRLIEI